MFLYIECGNSGKLLS